MAHQSHPSEAHATKPLDISNLMSPPELPKLESFSQSEMSKRMGAEVSDVRRVPGRISPLSPPISPPTKAKDHDLSISHFATTPVKDPILYPSHDITSSPPHQPLFGIAEPLDTQRIVHDHELARSAGSSIFFNRAEPPATNDYELALSFRSAVMQKFEEDRGKWLKRERACLVGDRTVQAKQRRFEFQHILPAQPHPVRKEAQRIAKPSAKVSKDYKHAQSKPRPIRSGPHPTTIVAKPTAARSSSETPDSSTRRAVAPNRVDTDYDALPDYCPPLNSLPNKANNLKTDWKGTPTDLSNDPDRHLLHPDELLLASHLRLNCATYLTSKRRIFVRRLECARVGKEFRKTDAQQACKIDVNKASKLWSAFDKVGWLQKSWMDAWLRN
ncbi:hypothetical protein F5Y15DRAFT_81420 [Xylariaceae sp. FL0016]|nr:hypothetical protein F5Y15DRAFT_81420 [Xylariaceae sp. FL0016]